MTSFTQSVGQWIKKHPIGLAVIVLLLYFLCNLYRAYLGNPFKITDPASPRFKIESFHILDYAPSELNGALVRIFPKGTDKTTVISVMRSAGGTLTHTNQKEIVRYEFPKNLRNWYDNPFIVFVFDENNKLENIKPYGGNELY